jgi:hypothetical protein
MPTIGSRAANAKLAINQGSDFSFEMDLKDSVGAVVSLTGSSFQGQVRKTKDSPTVVCSFVVAVNTTTNKVTFSLANTVTAAIPAGPRPSDSDSQYVYDIDWIKPGGSKERILEGIVEVSSEVTR